MLSSRKQYPFDLIEPKWQQVWDAQQTFRAWNPGESVPADHPFAARHAGRKPEELPKFYLLDMFPYPSGAGLHVGHPEGYTATDILSRYRRAQGYNVLHPMGWDAFGLPAEQYAVKTGQHPRITTEQNIATFKRQIQSLGFSYDWSREIDTTDPKYFRWTQWIFLQLYNSWFNPATNEAEPIETLMYPEELQERAADVPPAELESNQDASEGDKVNCQQDAGSTLEARRRAYRDSKRLAYVSEAPVWWCEELGTVLANEEVVDGKSEVGGFPVTRRPMRQWLLRITAYAEKLLQDLETINWTHSLKEMQRNWIGRSEGAEVDFQVEVGSSRCDDRTAQRAVPTIRVFTTRPDTLFGATYMVLSPEHKLVDQIVGFATAQPRINGKITAATVAVIDSAGAAIGTMALTEALEKARVSGIDLIEVVPSTQPPVCVLEDYGSFRFYQQEITKHVERVKRYREEVAKKSDLERTELAKEKTGVFTGAFAINPVNGERIPIWIADYVLASYGTGAIMAVPGHDTRDLEFATKFNLPIVQVVQPPDEKTDWHGFVDNGTSVNSASEAVSLNGLPTPEAKQRITAWLESKGIGKRTINYKLRDWLFSRQRYWGEPFPIVWKKDAQGNEYHEALPESALPLLPPKLDDYKPTKSGEPPLARAQDWVNLPDGSRRELNTMPQWAGSCWYYLRFLDARNNGAFVSEEAEQYWMGGEGVASLHSYKVTSGQPAATPHVTMQPCNHVTPGVDLYVGGTEHAVLHLLYARFWHKVLYDLGHVSTPEPFFKLVNQGLILGEDGQKMSKSRGNVVNPDDILKEFGADAFRLYEMFMGPLEMVKPWNTKGVEGVYRFLGRVWRLFVDEQSETEFEQALTTTEARRHGELLDLIKLNPASKDVEPSAAQLKALHACIKKVTEDLDHLRFNTAISAMMIFVNEAMTWEVKPVTALRTFLILLQPFSPHLAEELWGKLESSRISGLKSQIPLAYQPWPTFDPALLVEATLEIAVQVNGKLRDRITIAADATASEIEAAALAAEKVKPFLEGKTILKIIVVPKKLVNIAVG